MRKSKESSKCWGTKNRLKKHTLKSARVKMKLDVSTRHHEIVNLDKISEGAQKLKEEHGNRKVGANVNRYLKKPV